MTKYFKTAGHIKEQTVDSFVKSLELILVLSSVIYHLSLGILPFKKMTDDKCEMINDK
ncbi:MAG: hypothetical protein ABIF87_11535 [Pseudomonadota bacterium]